MKLKVIIVVLMILLLNLIFIGCTSRRGDNDGGEWGDAPDFSLFTLNNENIKLSDFLGKVIVIDLMGINCQYCVYMMPVLKALSENYSKSDLEIISVDVYQYESREYLQSFVDAFDNELNMKLDWYFGMDSDGFIAQSYFPDGQIRVPKIVIIDQNGNVYYSSSGYKEYSLLESKIKELL